MTGDWTNHIWQSTVFALTAGLLTLGFRANRATVRYWLWFSASVKFLMPFSLLIVLGSRVDWSPAAKGVVTAPASPVTLALEQISRPFPARLPQSSPAQNSHSGARRTIFLLWACGFASVALMRSRGWRRVRRALASSVASGIAAPVEVRFSPGLLEPGVVGWRRPVLLLPAGIAEYLTPAQLKAVMAHEFCHVRRRDNWFASIHMMVEALFWFHPLVWWIGAKLVEERERACDEEVLSLGGEPRVYAEGILNVCRLYVESPLVCVSGVTGSNLKKRIEAIMQNRVVLRMNSAKKAILAVAGICALAMPVVVGIMNAPHIRAQSAAGEISKFETISIRSGCAPSATEPRKSGDGSRKSGLPAPAPPGTLNLGCSTVAGMIHAAYGPFASGRPLEHASPLHYLDAIPMSGGPAWIYTDEYQVQAKAPGDPGLQMMRGPMMQALLEDRFHVKIRRDTRIVPAYTLLAADDGPRMPPYTGDCISNEVLPPLPPGKMHCWEVAAERGEANFTPHFAPDTVVQDLDEFALWLFVMTDRPVLNRTGINGRFYLDFVFAPDQATPGALSRLAIMARRSGGNAAVVPAPSNPPGPSIFEALRQQLGLKLEGATASREFLIVEHAERPTTN